MNLYHFVFNQPVTFLEFLGLGTWKVVETDIDLLDPNVNVLAQDPAGFQVTYLPDPEECKDGAIVVYQIVSSTGGGGSPAHADCASPGSGECKLPNTKKLLPGDTSTSYKDSPGSRDNTGPFGQWTWRLTAVATCRSACKEKVLSTYYFEFDNGTRKLKKVGADNPDHLKNGMQDWKEKGGAVPDK